MDYNRRWKNYKNWLVVASLAMTTFAQETVRISDLPRVTTLTGTNLFVFTHLGNPNVSQTITDANLGLHLILPYQILVYGNVPTQLNNARQLVAGNNVTFGTTSTSLVVNATGGGGGSSGLPSPPSTNASLLTFFNGTNSFGAISNFLFNGSQWFMPINTAWFEWHPLNGLQIKDGVNFKIGNWLTADGTEIAQFKSAAEGKDANTIMRKGDIPAFHFETELSDESTKITTTGLKKSKFAFRPFMLNQVAVSLNSVQTNGPAFTVEVRKNTNLISVVSIENNRHLAIVAAAESLGIGDRIDYHVTQVGKGAAGAKVYLIGE